MNKVVFILGAGASHRLGFPLGDGLKRELLHRLQPGQMLTEALAASGLPVTAVTEFAHTLRTAEYDTIDDHLRQIDDPDTRLIGKRAVAYLIRMKETQNLFHENSQPRHWYKELVNYLGRHRDHVSPDSFTFITYNYDRSLPHYLFETLRARRFPETQLKQFLGAANLHHVHGHVGPLPWQLERGGDELSYYQYGAEISITDLAKFRPNILHPDDSRSESILLSRMIGQAQFVVFVGFGFHHSNMQHLPLLPDAPTGNFRRRYFSINPVPPPTVLRFEGSPPTHISGQAETVFAKFFADLESGQLLAPN